MTGLVRRATLITAVGLMAAGAALAGVPNAGNSQGAGPNQNIILGGRNGTTVDPNVQKTITVRDAANNPVPNSVVVINFSTCTANDIRLCDSQPFAGLFINCAAKTISAVTNASGIATFRIVGGATNAFPLVNPPGAGANCAAVTADGVSLGSLTVAAADEDNSGGYQVFDTSNYFNDRLATQPAGYRGRSDFFTGDGNVLNVFDTSAFFVVRLGGGGGASCGGAACP